MMSDRIINILPACGLCILCLAVALPVHSLSASAQQPACALRCRAEFVFDGTCHKPSVGAKLFSGRILGVSLECPNAILQIEIQIVNCLLLLKSNLELAPDFTVRSAIWCSSP
jgi:hypothetical protein